MELQNRLWRRSPKHRFSPTGPSPGTSGRLSGSWVLPTRARGDFKYFYMVRSTLSPFPRFSKIRGGGDPGTGPHVQEGLRETHFWTHFPGILWIRTTRASCTHTENSTMIQTILQIPPYVWENSGRGELVIFVSELCQKNQT